MSNYKQVTGIGIKTISSDAHTNETLKTQYQSNDLVTIYFGLKDDNGNYEGKLTESSYKLTSTISGCHATISTIDSTKTAGIITYTISKNTTGSARLITFKYKDTELFKINQVDTNTLIYNSEYVYICTVTNISNSPDNIWLFAILTDNGRVPNKSDLLNGYKTMVQFDSSYARDNRKNGRTLYFSQKTLPVNKTIQELKNSGVLTVIRENNQMVQYNTDIPYHLVLVNNNAYNAPYNIQSNIEDSFKTPYEMYVIKQNDTVSSYQRTKFNIFDNYYYGIYKFNS